MRLIDLYFQALQNLRVLTKDNANAKDLRRLITHSTRELDKLTSIKYESVIEKEWVENIEEGLIYIEKAIREERQFIRTEGEVIQIEKVKKVSKASIQHLSRHSNLIRQMPNGTEDIIPEKLYIVEKLSDYQVYENRFIYMLLKYLKDFIRIRLDDIKDKTTTYRSTMNMDKEINSNDRRVTYKLDYTDLHTNDPYLIDQYLKNPMIDRVETIHAIVNALLATPLMKEVSKAPLVKPPIIKTNVLRMNPNFKAALNLYDFVSSYNENGYTIKEVKKDFNPFSNEMSDEIAETIQLTSVIAYIYGTEIYETIQKGYEETLKEIENQESELEIEELKRLKKRILELNEDPTEYLLKLEKRNIKLEKNNQKLKRTEERNRELQLTIDRLEEDKLDLNETIRFLNEEIKDKVLDIEVLNQKYFDDLEEVEEIHRSEIDIINKKHQHEIDELKEYHRLALIKLNDEHKERHLKLTNLYEQQLSEQETLHQTEKITLTNEYEARIDALNDTIDGNNLEISSKKQKIKELIFYEKQSRKSYESNISSLKKDLKKTDNQAKFSNAQYIALKTQQGLLGEDNDFSTKEQFKQLEKERKAYNKLFKEQWKKAKLNIRRNARKNILNEEE